MQIQAFKASDEAAVVRLVGPGWVGATADPLTAWRWRHLRVPEAAHTPFAALAWDNGQLAGVRAAVPCRLVVAGRTLRGAQLLVQRSPLVESFANPDASGSFPVVSLSELPRLSEGEPSDPPLLSEELRLNLARNLMAQAHDDGVRVLYGVAESEEEERDLRTLGFERPFDVVLRNLYLGLGSVSQRLDEAALLPIRRLAQAARSIRQKLIEVPVDEGWLVHAASLFGHRRNELGFAVDRDLPYLRWRYADHPEKRYRMLILRRRAGQGIDAFAIVRMFQGRTGRRYIQLVDHWTRFPERSAMMWLLGELALFGLCEKADVLQAFAAVGSSLDQTLVSSGAIRKKATLPFLVRWLDQPQSREPLLAAVAQIRAGDLDLY